MAYVIAEPCFGIEDQACVEICPVDCIHPKKGEADYESHDMLYIDPVLCVECGACVPVCPASAIFPADELPAQWAHYSKRNAAYYGRNL